jgi:protoporphyrinogen oxidase
VDKIVIVGGGITGLIAALLYRKKHPKAIITIIEKNQALGGLLRSFDYGDNGIFDYGIHTLYDTGIPELDTLIRSCIPIEDWIELSGTKRDFGGSYLNGKLQDNSPYIDVRNFFDEDIDILRTQFLEHLKLKLPLSFDNAESYLVSKYGTLITETIFKPVVQKYYNVELSASHWFITKILPLERIVLFDDKTIEELAKEYNIQTSIAFENQLNMPAEFVADKSAWYPKKHGIFNYISALEQELLELNVTILKGTSIDVVETNENNTLDLISNTKGTFNEVDKLVWTSGISSCFNTVIKQPINLAYHPPVKTCFVNIKLKEKPKVKGLFYVYVLEASFISHRLSCPFSFCENAYEDGTYNLAVEVILKQTLTDGEIEERVIKELGIMKVIDKSDILFQQTEHITGGYPTLTLQNIMSAEFLKESIQTTYPTQIELFGLMSKENLFFQVDILRDLYHSING